MLRRLNGKQLFVYLFQKLNLKPNQFISMHQGFRKEHIGGLVQQIIDVPMKILNYSIKKDLVKNMIKCI